MYVPNGFKSFLYVLFLMIALQTPAESMDCEAEDSLEEESTTNFEAALSYLMNLFNLTMFSDIPIIVDQKTAEIHEMGLKN